MPFAIAGGGVEPGVPGVEVVIAALGVVGIVPDLDHGRQHGHHLQASARSGNHLTADEQKCGQEQKEFLIIGQLQPNPRDRLMEQAI